MNKIIQLILFAHKPVGTIIAVGSLWVGCFAGHFCPLWMNIPVFVTTALCMCLGVLLVFKDVNWLREL
jgi:uncharacterized protein (DUF983 family)